MVRKMHDFVQTKLTFIASLLILIVVFAKASWPDLTWYTFFPPQPYEDVKVVEDHQAGPWRTLGISFIKNGCDRESVVFVGSKLGVPSFLAWVGLDGAEPDHDRAPGYQYLKGKLYVGPQGVDWIEIRTRHTCHGIRIDKVLLRVDGESKGTTHAK